MVKNSCLVFVLCLLFQKNSFSQSNNSGGELLTTSQHKVMIIPFNQYNYFSDADDELAFKNKKETKDISTLFRFGLNYNISARVISAGAYNILTDTTVQSQKDLHALYSSIKYEYEKPMDAFAKDSAENKQIIKKDLFGNGGEEQENDAIENKQKSDPVESLELTKYLNAKLMHPEVLAQLKSEFGTDLFLFINQFELITNYNHCLDFTAQYFERKVVVHYSLYNASGKQLKGEAVTVTFSSAQTNIDEIIGSQFPVIAEFLQQSLLQSLNSQTKK